MHRPTFSIPAGLPLLLCFAWPGCNDGETDTSAVTDPSTDPATGDEPPTTTNSPTGAPVVMELLTNKPTLTEGEPITFTAIVVDPDGLDTIVSGKLTTEDGGGFYGAFAHIGGGTFQIVLTFELIGETSKIEFKGPEQPRVFKAEFADIDGNVGSRTVEIKLSCASNAACASQCVELDDDTDHCGVCGNKCVEGYSCINGDCSYGY